MIYWPQFDHSKGSLLSTDGRTDGRSGKDFVNQDQGKNLPRTFAKFHAEQGCKIVVCSSEAIHAYSEMSLEVNTDQL